MRVLRTLSRAVLGTALLVMAGLAPVALTSADRAAAAELAPQPGAEAEGMAAVTAWVKAVLSGDPDTIAPVLAPEFQILRADGSGYDAAGYLASELPIIAAMPDIENLVASRTGDILVTRYVISANQTRDGKVVETTAPRLTVFRRSGDRWLVVAHGNFAALEE